MLTLSPTAASLLAETRSRQGIPDDAMLRVAGTTREGEQQGFSLGFVTEPQEGDHTGSAHGMQICVAAEVADALEDAEIDARTDEGDVQLVIVPAS